MLRPSSCRRGASLSALAFALVLGATGSGPALVAGLPSKAILAQEPARQAKAQAYLMGLRSQLGLSEQEAFRPAHTFSTPAGKSVIRMDHTFRGYRVLGSQAIAHVSPEGGLSALTGQVDKGIALTGEPALGPDQALEIVLKSLNFQLPQKFAPKVERIVFPAEAVGGLVTTYDQAKGRQVLDRTRSAFPLIPTAHVWAYEVLTKEENSEQGPREMATIIDGNTGQILRSVDMLQRQAAPPITPATGTGYGLYRGTVNLSTTLLADGKYALLDTTRGSQPNPYLITFGTDPSGWVPTGIQTWFSGSDANGNSDHSMWMFMENPVNTWGDGLPFTQWGSSGGINGQTAAVDAHSAMATTWDFYGKVLGWDGLDGLGTTPYAEVLDTSTYGLDNASFSYWSWNLTIGAGSSMLPVNHPMYNPNGFKSLADFDVIAHEMAHGLTYITAGLGNYGSGYEVGGLSEGSSDFFAQMAKIWAQRPAGAPDDAIPDAGGDWQIGKNITPDGKPLRWMDKPSRDERSADAWYDGAHFLDGHFSAGILNRVLFFLAQGASATPGSDRYSPYLPGGMSGIGNDAATRIWFTTVTERLVGGYTITFQQCRDEAITAAKELYGAGADCPQSIAVENAFAAINVGLGHGQAPHTQLTFAGIRNGDWWDLNHSAGAGNSAYTSRQLFPEGHSVKPRITVLNNANTDVTWSLGGPSLFNTGASPGQYGWADKGGKLNPDGSWTTPWNLGWYAISATSKADPSQFAEGRCFIVNVDADQDGEFDACDMGGMAFSWWLGSAINPAHSAFQAPWTDDADVFAIGEAMQNAWPVK